MNLLGRDKITNTDQDDWGPVIDNAIDNAKDYILDLYSWSFAKRYLQLALLTENVDLAFPFSYQIPSDNVKVVNVYSPVIVDSKLSINQPLLKNQWEVFNNTVSSNTSEGLVLLYISSLTDINSQTRAFIKMYAYYVASIVCVSLTQETKLVSFYTMEFEKYLNTAVLLDQKDSNTYVNVSARDRTWLA